MAKKLTKAQQKLVEMIKAEGGSTTLNNLREKKLIDYGGLTGAGANAGRLAAMGVITRTPSPNSTYAHLRSEDVLTLVENDQEK